MKWDIELNLQLKSLVKRFNAKRKRLEFKGLTNIPPKLSIKEIRNKYRTRRDIKTFISDSELFLKRGSEEKKKLIAGSPVTLYEYEVTNRQVRRQRQRIDRRVKKLRLEYSGRFIPPVIRGEIKKLESQRQQISQPISKMTPSQVSLANNLILNYANRFISDSIFRNNFLDVLLKLAGATGMQPSDYTANFINKFQNFNPYKFYELYKRSSSLRALLSTYNIYSADIAQVDLSRDMIETVFQEIENFM